jgi:hypothetical protein
MTSSDRPVTRRDLAAALGCKPSYVNALRAAGRVVMAEDGKRYLLEATRRRIAQTADPSHQAVADRHAAVRGAALATAGAAGQGDAAAPAPIAAPADAADAAVAAISPSYADAKARRENAEASLKEIDLRKRQGEILERTDVAAALDLAIVKLAARVDALADVLPPQVVGLDDEARIRAIVAEAVLIVRRELSRDFAAALEAKA